jgi:hypothetical protein
LFILALRGNKIGIILSFGGFSQGKKAYKNVSVKARKEETWSNV